jgi:hypothetical protein
LDDTSSKQSTKGAGYKRCCIERGDALGELGRLPISAQHDYGKRTLYQQDMRSMTPGKKPASTRPSAIRNTIMPAKELIPLAPIDMPPYPEVSGATSGFRRRTQITIKVGRKSAGLDLARIMFEGISNKR